MIPCVTSKDDVTSLKIAKELINGYRFEKLVEPFRNLSMYQKSLSGKEVRLVTVKGELVFEQNIADTFSPDLVIFIS